MVDQIPPPTGSAARFSPAGNIGTPPPAAPAAAPLPMSPPPPLGAQEIRKLDLQMQMQDSAANRRTQLEDRRYFDLRLADERERSRYEQGRIRTELGENIKEGERQIEVLVRTLGRYQAENDRMREALAMARAEKASDHHGAKVDVAEQARHKLADLQQRMNPRKIPISPEFVGGVPFGPVKLVEPHDPQMPQGAP